MELSVSVLNAEDKVSMIKLLNETKISYIHLDVMDGKFVTKRSLSIDEIEILSKISSKKLDIHLMVEDPIEYIESIKKFPNIEYITIHLEINKNIKEIISKIKNYGYKAGLSIKPNTDLKEIIPYIGYIDLILLMTVEPGLGGQEFITSSSKRLIDLKEIVKESVKIEVDGGINKETIKNVKSSDIAVVGSYITKSKNPTQAINSLIV